MCGLAAEARIARRAGFEAVAGGGDPERTRALLAALLPRARLLISFGIAGGLDPALAGGRVVLSGEVVGDDGRWDGDPAWLMRIAGWAAELDAATGAVYGAPAIVAAASDKARARLVTGAVAVDLESAVVARAAAEAGIPFIVLRAVADAAPRDLPAAALIPLGPGGRPALARVMAAVAVRPGQLPGLIGLTRDTARALRALVGPARGLRRLLAGV